jgi:hypothetical protein
VLVIDYIAQSLFITPATTSPSSDGVTELR